MNFAITFVIVTIISELIFGILILLPKAKKLRSKDYSKKQTTVTARQVEQWSRDYQRYIKNRSRPGNRHKGKSSSAVEKYVSTKYEWEYNGKKHHKVFRSTSYPTNTQMVITINKRTGKYQSPKGEIKVGCMGVLTFVFSIIIGLIAAAIICK